MNKRFYNVICLPLALCLFGCATPISPTLSPAETPAKTATPAPTPILTQTLAFLTEAGEVHLQVEVPQSREAFFKGLRGRTEIADGEGMWFDFGQEVSISFTMEGIAIPLSIAFLSKEGRIVDIQDMAPEGTYSSREKYWYAVEVKQGFFERNGVRIGACVLRLLDSRPWYLLGGASALGPNG